VARQELRQKARPELTGRVDTMGDYTVVFLGYPNWWSTMPMAVFTFLEAYDFSGKTIIPLCTHEGSGMGHSESDIAKLCPAATVLKGLAITGGSVHQAEIQIATWLRELGVIE
jgi:flavodoxin